MWKSLLLVAVLVLAMYFDVREKKIKNYITIPAALAGAVINFTEHGAAGLAVSLQGWVIPVLVLFVLYYTNIMGAGDIKLFAAIGSIMGLPFLSYSFLFSVYCGGLVALFILIKRKVFFDRMKRVFSYLKYILLTGQLAAYSAKEDTDSKFIFTTAVVPGTMLQLVLVFLRQKGVINC